MASAQWLAASAVRSDSVFAVAANGDLWGFSYEAGSSFAEVGDLGVQVIV